MIQNKRDIQERLHKIELMSPNFPYRFTWYNARAGAPSRIDWRRLKNMHDIVPKTQEEMQTRKPPTGDVCKNTPQRVCVREA